MKKKYIIVVTTFIFLIFAGLGCKKQNSTYKTSLSVWGTFDNSSVFNDVFGAYSKVNDNVSSISYQKHTLETYKRDLLNALAAGTGPDIFMIQNSWLPDFQDKIEPAPDYLFSESEFRNNFIDVVSQDVLQNGKIYGTALSADSLALYYNKDIFNAAGIVAPPKTWDELDEIVKKLTIVDEYGNLLQNGITMGTANNINRAVDILTVLMLQRGVEMSDQATQSMAFNKPVNNGIPSVDALRYYTSFAHAGDERYTWNKFQAYSIDRFFEGKSAMTINYAYNYDTIAAKNAKLNFAVVDLPQLSTDKTKTPVNFANYWILVVAKNKIPDQNASDSVVVTNDMRIHESWQLLKALSFPTKNGVKIQNFISGKSLMYPIEFDLTERYLTSTKKPAARKDLIAAQLDDVRLGAFARGNLIAQSWWRKDAAAVENIFSDMINEVNIGQQTEDEAINLGVNRAQQLQSQ